MLPHARVNELIVRELPEETLVYDQKHDKAHCLNRAAALVWRHCDGQTTGAAMAKILHDELQVPVDEQLVCLALDQLERARLLQERIASPRWASLYSRRDFARKLGIAVGVVPMVMTILAPAAMANNSCISLGGSCNNQHQCCAPGSCSGGICR